ncbi:MAG: PDZ domain-containing protein [Chitinophagaceae bacterium]|nr:MAG: PDZ domain-containing protein [Chitinophagaceae bacterium]
MKKFYNLVCAIGLFGPLAAIGQEEFIEPASRPLTSFQFRQITGGVVLFKALFDDSPDSLQFVLDSGSSGISLDSTTAARLKQTPLPSDRTIRGIAGIRRVSFLYNRKLHLPGLTVDSLNFHVNDYSMLTSVYGEQVDGIIGYALLSRFIIKLNYDDNVMQVCSQGTFRYPNGGFMIKPMLSTLPFQVARVKDERSVTARFLHDIGAGVCLMLSKEFAEDSAILQKKRKLLPKEGEGVGGSIRMDVTVVKELKIGPYRFRNIPTYIFDDTYNVTSYPTLGGLIGNDIFRRFNVIFNYAKRDIHIVPNTHFRDPFDYSYSGLEIYFVDGKIVVGDVSAKSPAEKAGMREGDIIVSVNNDFSQNFQQYKTALQATNAKIRIIVNRHDELVQFDFKIKSIL